MLNVSVIQFSNIQPITRLCTRPGQLTVDHQNTSDENLALILLMLNTYDKQLRYVHMKHLQAQQSILTLA